MTAPRPVTRRAALVTAGAAAASAVAGCSRAPADDGSTASSAATRGATAEIPVGGGRVFAETQVVVTRPTAQTLHAFSAVCPHQGCTVQTVADDVIVCPCHGSTFDVTDGSVVQGPAGRALARRAITVDGSSFVVEQGGA